MCFMPAVEHLVYLVQKAIVQRDQIVRCRWKVDDGLRHFMVAEHNHIFEVLPYSVPLAILVTVSAERSG